MVGVWNLPACKPDYCLVIFIVWKFPFLSQRKIMEIQNFKTDFDCVR